MELFEDSAAPGPDVHVVPFIVAFMVEGVEHTRQLTLHHQPPLSSRPRTIDIPTYKSARGAGRFAQNEAGDDVGGEVLGAWRRRLSDWLGGDCGNLPGVKHTRIMVRATCARRGLQRRSTSPGAG